MFDQFISPAVIAVLNRWLQREAWAREKLAPFASRVARLELPPLALVFAVTPEGSLATAPAGAQADVTLTADTAALPLLLTDSKALLRNVKLQGDMEFAQALGFVLQNLKPEPEEDLAPWLGDAAAVRVVGLIRAAFAQARDVGQRLAQATADYLVAEDQMLAARQDVDEFARAVGELRDATERMEARVRQLELAQEAKPARTGRPTAHRSP